jgi:hypothetical protein
MNKTVWRSPKLILGTLSLALCLGSCAKEHAMPENGANFEEVVAAMKSGTPLLEMSYTAETFSRVVKTSGSTGDFPKLDMAYMKPQSRRKDIQFTLMPSGSSSTIITKLTSKNPINIPTNVLENTSIPELNKIIATNEEIRLYDRNGISII